MKFWLDWFDKVVGFAVLVVFHPPNLGLMKEGFGRMSQPNLWLIKKVLAERASASQSTRHEVTN
jgi:hypothetical protein